MSDVGQLQNLDEVIGAYREHQRRTRGLADATLRNYESQARLFVRATLGSDPVDLSELTPADVVAFVSSLATRWAPSSMKTSRTALRSFLRYLSVQGVSDGRLEEVVPRVAHWRLSSLPHRLSDTQLDQLLVSLQDVGGRPCGPRDRAIVRCLATLGLRPVEIARLRLEDLDWRAATLAVVRRKNRRGQVLPLPGQVGEAIADYLHGHRPVTQAREVFVQQVGPRRGEPIGATAVSEVVARALERAGVKTSMAGAYVLRHTVASRMVARGVSLKEVADFLGHRDLDTAAIYAKLDLPALREVAGVWPEVSS